MNHLAVNVTYLLVAFIMLGTPSLFSGGKKDLYRIFNKHVAPYILSFSPALLLCYLLVMVSRSY